MKDRNFSIRLGRALALCALACAPFFQAAGAAEKGQEHVAQGVAQQEPVATNGGIATEIAKLRGQVRRVIVFAVSNDWSFRRQMGEADLPRIGCAYAFDDPAAVGRLMDLLAHAQFQHGPIVEQSLDIRMGIYLFTSSNEPKAILFARPRKYEAGDPLSTGDARGTFAGIGVVAKNPFHEKVTNLLAEMKPTKYNFYCGSSHK